MKLAFDRDFLDIRLEDGRDIVYVQNILGLKKLGDIALVVYAQKYFEDEGLLRIASIENLEEETKSKIKTLIGWEDIK